LKQWLLPGGFTLIVLFMLSVAAVAVVRMNTINDQMDEIVNQHNVKVGYMMTMYTAARERSVSMLTMTTMDDPFEREEEFEHFNEQATKFAVARMAYQEMSIDAHEKALLEKQMDLTLDAVPQQMRVIDLLATDEFEQAEQVLVNDAIPTQNKVLYQLSSMIDYQTQAAKDSLSTTRKLYIDTVRSIIVLAISAITLCIGTAWYVIRTLRRDEAELKAYNEKLADRVRERTADLEAAYRDLQNSQSQLVHSEKMASLGQLTAGIAHEIKNPLNFVNNFSETSRDLVNDLTDSLSNIRHAIPEAEGDYIDGLLGDLDSDLGKIENHGKRADGIVRSMLMHAREGGGQREDVDINRLVEENLNLAYHSERAKNKGFNINLVNRLDENAGQICVEPQEIARVLLNLFGNGFHATEVMRNRSDEKDYSPELVVETRRDNSSVWVEVTDNGIGMSKKVMEKIFDPFYTTKPAGEGTGLGLSLSFDIIKQSYNGKFEVESQENEGTTFRFSIPSRNGQSAS
jgi:signal transduction histidine kinase